jgi:hypothetical protein
MNIRVEKPIDVLVLAIPETAGSALYGMVDVLSATGNLWQTLVRSKDETRRFKVKIVSTLDRAFTCGNGVSQDRQYDVGAKLQTNVAIFSRAGFSCCGALGLRSDRPSTAANHVKKSSTRALAQYAANPDESITTDPSLIPRAGRSAAPIHFRYHPRNRASGSRLAHVSRH